MNNNLLSDLKKVIKDMSPIEQDVICLRFDLDGSGAKTLAQVGKLLDLTPERVRQIEAKILRRFRSPRSPQPPQRPIGSARIPREPKFFDYSKKRKAL